MPIAPSFSGPNRARSASCQATTPTPSQTHGDPGTGSASNPASIGPHRSERRSSALPAWRPRSTSLMQPPSLPAPRRSTPTDRPHSPRGRWRHELRPLPLRRRRPDQPPSTRGHGQQPRQRQHRGLQARLGRHPPAPPRTNREPPGNHRSPVDARTTRRRNPRRARQHHATTGPAQDDRQRPRPCHRGPWLLRRLRRRPRTGEHPPHPRRPLRHQREPRTRHGVHRLQSPRRSQSPHPKSATTSCAPAMARPSFNSHPPGPYTKAL